MQTAATGKSEPELEGAEWRIEGQAADDGAIRMQTLWDRQSLIFAPLSYIYGAGKADLIAAEQVRRETTELSATNTRKGRQLAREVEHWNYWLAPLPVLVPVQVTPTTSISTGTGTSTSNSTGSVVVLPVAVRTSDCTGISTVLVQSYW
jgi:hypothetical protein